MHRLTNRVITVDGDRGEARTYVDGLIMFGEADPGVNAVGFYDDDLVRTAAGWRVAGRRFTPVHVIAVGEDLELRREVRTVGGRRRRVRRCRWPRRSTTSPTDRRTGR